MDAGAAHDLDWQTARVAGATALRPLLDELPAREQAWLEVADPAAAHGLLAKGIQLATVREGANPLTDYWRAVEEALGTHRPVPPQYRFGMGDN
jgi:hypothetical protein